MSRERSDRPKNAGHGKSSGPKLVVVTLVNLVGFLAEFLGGIFFGSIALMSDAIHMLFDALAYGIAALSAHFADSFEDSDRWNFGLHRIEVLSALLNGFVLIPMAGWIIWEAYHRFLTTFQIDFQNTLLLALGGLALNVVSVLYLKGEKMDLNEKAAFYHLLGDVGGSIAVIVGILIVHLTGIKIADPIAAILISVLVVWSAIKVLAEGTGIILQKSPFSPTKIERAIEGLEGVRSVHKIRSWNVCSEVDVCTLHAKIDVVTWADADKVRMRIVEKLKEKFGFNYITVQIEKAEEDF